MRVGTDFLLIGQLVRRPVYPRGASQKDFVTDETSIARYERYQRLEFLPFLPVAVEPLAQSRGRLHTWLARRRARLSVVAVRVEEFTVNFLSSSLRSANSDSSVTHTPPAASRSPFLARASSC